MRLKIGSVRSAGILILAAVLGGATSCTPIARQPDRSMTVTGGPERVFEQPVEEIWPQLVQATATGENGRIGDEMVFWGYRLRTGEEVNFFACSPEPDVDCEQRLAAVCDGSSEMIARKEGTGLVRHLQCRLVGVAAPGELRPNCDDKETDSTLLIGLMQCN